MSFEINYFNIYIHSLRFSIHFVMNAKQNSKTSLPLFFSSLVYNFSGAGRTTPSSLIEFPAPTSLFSQLLIYQKIATKNFVSSPMDTLPSELLKAVCNFLPLKSRLLTRHLSSADCYFPVLIEAGSNFP